MSLLRLSSALAALTLVAAAAGCGPSAGADDDGGPGSGVDADPNAPDGNFGPTTRISGRVWFPNQGPGQAAPGEEIPVFDAMVYLSNAQPPPIPQQVYCEKCVDAPGNAKFSAHDGSFEINAVRGTYWLVIQKGQWRLEQQITVGDAPLDLPAAMTTLPSEHDPAAGAWMPKMAIILGTNDNIEDVLGKVGVGTLTGGTDFTAPAGENGPEITVYNSSDSGTYFALDTLRQYHIVFFPCSTTGTYGSALSNEATRKNLRTYVNEGGKLYVTDWSGEVMDMPFPPQITLGGAGYDTTGTYNPQTLDGTVTSAGSSNGDLYDSSDAEVVDDDLDQWIGLQMMPTEANATPMTINPDSFVATHNWNWISALTQVQTGEDQEGLPLYDDPKAWVIGSGPDTGGQKKPLTVTFEPAGCGRVLFSTYQTAGASSFDHHVGLYPQERVLLYLIGEIGVCSDNPIVE